jgi:hypothetical protein
MLSRMLCTGRVETGVSVAADEYAPMSPVRVRFSVRSMMTGIAAGAVLVFLGIRIAYAARLVGTLSMGSGTEAPV